ncbi:hypothetical protein NFI96_009459 [Prochilodus magdalenae]|nr:hypothetical protein NFI96_009459 [Prochilodus magdalenae]
MFGPCYVLAPLHFSQATLKTTKGPDTCGMWQGLRHITDYQQRSREVTTSHTTLPDELNEFYALFEALNPNRHRGSRFTYDCVASQSNTSIIKFADDTTVIGLITGGDETGYRREVAELVDWCDYNNLSLNTDKTKEMIVDPRRRRQELHTPLFIGGTEVERVKTFKFLGVHISEDLTWSHNTHYIVRKSQQRLYFLKRLRKFGMSAQILSNFYRSTIKSALTSSITVWYGNCTAQDRKALQRVIKTAQSISGAAFPSLQDIYRTRVIRRAHSIISDSTHPQHSLFTLLPSG